MPAAWLLASARWNCCTHAHDWWTCWTRPRAIATQGEPGHRTAKAVEWLRANYAKPLRVEGLATMARMSVSTLHRQFRSLTTMSPLQFQKQLRLHVARERMLHNGMDAASAAFEVGRSPL